MSTKTAKIPVGDLKKYLSNKKMEKTYVGVRNMERSKKHLDSTSPLHKAKSVASLK